MIVNSIYGDRNNSHERLTGMLDKVYCLLACYVRLNMYRIVSALRLTGGLGRGIEYSRRNNMDYTEIFDCKMWSSIFACFADQNTDAESMHGEMICMEL